MTVSKRTKNIATIIAVIAVIGIIFFILSVASDRKEQARKEKKEKAVQINRIDSLERANVVLDSLGRSCVENFYSQNDSLKAKDTTIARLNHEKDSIKGLLDKCKGVKKKPAAKKMIPIKKTVATALNKQSAPILSPLILSSRQPANSRPVLPTRLRSTAASS